MDRLIPLLVAAVLLSSCGGFSDTAFSDVVVENVMLEMPATTAEPAIVTFDISWGNSFRDDLNWDAVWVFVKFREPGQDWRHATLSTSPTAHTVAVPNGVIASLVPATDGRGIFVYRAASGFSSIDWDQVSLAWDFVTDGVSRDTVVEVAPFALEMVYVPEGEFMLGDGTSVAALLASQFEGGARGAPFVVDGEDALVMGGAGGNSLGNNDRAMPAATTQQFWDDFTDSNRQELPAAFPKGYSAFYVMKHELTQGEYARFLGFLTPSQQGARNPAAGIPAGEEHRYAISAAAPFRVAPYNRALNYVSWMDLAAYADWSGLRPMTELEFEKAARGGRIAAPGEFAWGPEAPPAGKYSLQDPDTPQELVTNQSDGANVAFDGTVGEASSLAGPLRAGAFVPLATSRLAFGGSFYRLTELSGNVAEMVVTVGRPAGRRFTGIHGDGLLSPAGNAGGSEVELWPGARRIARGGYEVLNADGTGTRGGDWAGDVPRLQISDRSAINVPADHRDMRWGGRLVRSAR